MSGSATTLGQCRGNGERMSDLERAIGKVTAAIGQAEDVEVIADLVAERRAMRVELEELRRRAADNVVDLSRFR
jgi:regulator of replication initiation timing